MFNRFKIAPVFVIILMGCSLIVPGQAEVTFDVSGVAAGEFNPAFWQANTLNLVADTRSPLLEPRPGKHRNIYAPSIVETPEGWRVFYGAWDGVETGNDRIYSTTTTDFLTFGPRKTIIEHGDFIHVCNVHALRHSDGSYELATTCYPVGDNTNKPGYFTSPDGLTWNGSLTPLMATKKDIVTILDYPAGYEQADINGMNVLLRDGGDLFLYFCDFHNFKGVYRAKATGERKFVYEGVALNAPGKAVNDIRQFTSGGKQWYVMGLHINTNRLWYSLSNDGKTFETPPKPLLSYLGQADRYIVAIGFVTKENRLLGLLYGAGANPNLAENRIFARWLQKRVVFVDNTGVQHEATVAYGPDRQRFTLPGSSKTIGGELRIYAEDGITPLKTIPVRVKPGTTISIE